MLQYGASFLLPWDVAGESVAQHLIDHASLTEDSSAVPRTHVKGGKPIVTVAPGAFNASSFQRNRHSYVHVHTDISK